MNRLVTKDIINFVLFILADDLSIVSESKGDDDDLLLIEPSGQKVTPMDTNATPASAKRPSESPAASIPVKKRRIIPEVTNEAETDVVNID